MSFEVGREKTGGRIKGTPNKRTSQLADILEENDIDLPTKILEILPALSVEKQVDVLLQLMPYIYVKRKAVEVEVAVEVAHGLEPRDIELMKQAKAMSREQLTAEIDRLNANRELIQAEYKSIEDAKLRKETKSEHI